jgi:hypothetical protein
VEGGNVDGGEVAGAEVGEGGFAVELDPLAIGTAAGGGKLVAGPHAERTRIETSIMECNRILISFFNLG